MHGNQLLKIAQLVNNNGIQFMASIFKDKLREELNREEYFVVKLSLESLPGEVITSGFLPEIIGRNFLVLAEKSASIEEAIGYAAIIMKAIHAREKRPPTIIETF